MEAIDRITSRKKIVRMRGTGRLLTVETWNGTLANLTLLALGSSAPEILLSIVEVLINGFHAGALGPGTMIGSAAFNLCCIVGVSCISIPSPEIRKVEHRAVFMVTAVFAMFAYAWLCFIVQINTPDVVTVSEGLCTIGFYPILLVLAYLAHIGYFSGGSASPPKPAVKPLPTEVGDPGCIRDELGQPIINPNGVLSFQDDIEEVLVGLSEKIVSIPVQRKNGACGQVSCKYRMEGRSAVASKDFVQDEGDVVFPEGVTEAIIPVTILPKSLGEHSDQFQIIIEDAKGGATFNPNSDGKEGCCILTICIVNDNDNLMHRSTLMRVSQLVDGAVNMDAITLATSSWSSAVGSALSNVTKGENGQPASGLDIAMNLVFLPWRLGFAILVPPPGYCGGWLSFFVCMCFIGFLSSCICDFSELFGCVTGVDDYITAITLVAMGTSMPDLFVSSTAAVQDEYADSSICTVTGGDSARVFLGIGIPWTMAALYWGAVGPTEEWKATYPEYVAANPEGAFIVPGGMLGFNVVMYLLTAMPVLVAINLRRAIFGGELGGPFGPKVLTGIAFFLMWCFYLYMSIWKIQGGSDDLIEVLKMIWSCVTTLEHIGLVFVVFVFCCVRQPKPAADAEKEGLMDEEHGLADAKPASQLHDPYEPRKDQPPYITAATNSPLRQQCAVYQSAPTQPWAGASYPQPPPEPIKQRVQFDVDEFHDCDAEDTAARWQVPENAHYADPQYGSHWQQSGIAASGYAAYGGEAAKPAEHSGFVPNVVVGMAVNKLKRPSQEMLGQQGRTEQWSQHVAVNQHVVSRPAPAQPAAAVAQPSGNTPRRNHGSQHAVAQGVPQQAPPARDWLPPAHQGAGHPNPYAHAGHPVVAPHMQQPNYDAARTSMYDAGMSGPAGTAMGVVTSRVRR
eukprot:TRINITY_DN8231_c0_g1_i1.p1 TRINITY_DN8231_c0_g1~~TRINITY_DN8231_c0_g1_i1.p1  ORF type:complete len:1002 (+),score=125.90 TRINITY_DN8231_c0_g1_i1:292-3006(+)